VRPTCWGNQYACSELHAAARDFIGGFMQVVY
jgi:hypothetical protein